MQCGESRFIGIVVEERERRVKEWSVSNVENVQRKILKLKSETE